MTRDLTPKQQRFVEEYLVDLNATQAATRAGYSARTANEQGARLLAHVSVASAIEEAKAKRSERTEITQDYVVGVIHETIQRCSDDEAYNPQAVLKGAELLGRHLQMFVDRKEVGKPGEFSELSDTERSQELARLLEAGRAAKAGQTTH